MPIFGSGDPASDAVDKTYSDCAFHIDTIICSLRCQTCDKESKITSQLQMLLLRLSQEPAASSVAGDLRQYLRNSRRSQ